MDSLNYIPAIMNLPVNDLLPRETMEFIKLYKHDGKIYRPGIVLRNIF